MSNALRDMRAAGIPVNWDVVRVGWTGPGTLGPQLTVDDIRTFAGDAIVEARGAEAAAIAALSTATSEHDVMENLEHLGSLSPEGKRAWRVFLLRRLLEALPASPVDALAELTSFWSAFGFPSESPHVVQGRGNTISPAEYYTRDMKDRMVAAHRAWVAQELPALQRAMTSPTVQQLREWLRAFVDGDSSKDLAGRIEVGLDRLFPEDERFVDLVDALASYEPGGGDLLFSYERVVPLCRAALKALGEGPL